MYKWHDFSPPPKKQHWFLQEQKKRTNARDDIIYAPKNSEAWCYPSEPGLEGALSEEMEVTEATDSGLWEEGMVKDLTMEGGRDPRRSSAGGWQQRRKQTNKQIKNRKLFSLNVTDCFVVT